ncbi:UNVERIFIED_CONTAM: hypothetical protein RMT77_004818 [Armadillidium vulgare]
MYNFTFRKHYIGNVEFSDSASKQALQVILREQPIDIKKLTEFTLKTTLPSTHRTVVWKLLCGITPRFAASQEFVHQQHMLMFQDLFRTLRILRLGAPLTANHIGETNNHSNGGIQASLKLYRNGWNGHLCDVKNPEPEHLFLMWLISESRLIRDPESQLLHPENQCYILTGHKLHCLIDDPIELFHISCSLWTLMRLNESEIRNCVKSAAILLKKKNDCLHHHLSHIGLFSHPFLEEQSLCLFCEIFQESSIEKIFDKVFAGSFKIISILIVCLLCQLQHSLLTSMSVENVRNILYQIRKEQADIVLSSTLDIFHKKTSIAAINGF